MASDECSKTLAEGTATVRPPDPEVVPQAKPRQFSAEYKLRILAEADRCTRPAGGSAASLYLSFRRRLQGERATQAEVRQGPFP